MRRLFALAALLTAGCQAEIGDKCNTSTDCAPNGGRVCDLASPGGYCSITPCDPNSCPDGALCVEWRYEANRTSETWCMRRCSGDGDCGRRQYKCRAASSIVSTSGESLARVTDFDGRELGSFCVYVPD